MTNKKLNYFMFSIFLLIVFVCLSIWTGFKIYKHYNGSHIEESTHYMYVYIDTSKNLTLEEVNGYSSDPSIVRYNIIQKGSIFFKTLSPGLSFYKEVDIINRNNFPVEFSYKTNGNISGFITVEVPKYNLAPKETITLNITITIPEKGVVSGSYSGNLTVKLNPVKA